jgi:hypothetical protein
MFLVMLDMELAQHAELKFQVLLKSISDSAPS